MPQINLLKQTENSSNLKQLTPKIFVWVFLGLLILLAAYYGYLIFQGQNYQKNINDVQAKINSEIDEAGKLSGRSELLVRQQQLQDFTKLIQGHVYWSQIFSKLAEVTLSKAVYTSMAVDSSDGSVVLNTTVPSLEYLDKYMQVFDQPDVIKYFSNVRIGGFSKTQSVGGVSAVQFMVKMDYDPSIIQYNNSK